VLKAKLFCWRSGPERSGLEGFEGNGAVADDDLRAGVVAPEERRAAHPLSIGAQTAEAGHPVGVGGRHVWRLGGAQRRALDAHAAGDHVQRIRDRGRDEAHQRRD